MKRQDKKGRWVARRPFVYGSPGEWCSFVYAIAGSRTDHIHADGRTRAECIRRASAIRDPANKEGW